jgi:predicted hydrocarbon binding protein
LRRDRFSFQFETFRDMAEALELIFSDSAASAILFTAAVRCGTQCFKRAVKEGKKRQDAVHYLSELKREENWGEFSFSHVDFMKGIGRVVVTDSFETVPLATRGHRTKRSQSCCHFLRGFLAGFLSELFQKPTIVTEEKCAGKGDEHCEFAFKPGEDRSEDLK